MRIVETPKYTQQARIKVIIENFHKNRIEIERNYITRLLSTSDKIFTK